MKAEEIFELAKTNKHRATVKYYSQFDTFADIELKPKFELNTTSNFFTIGSCFARNIENFFNKKDIAYLSRVPAVDGQFFKAGGVARNGYQNVYTPGSVLEMSRLCHHEDKYHSIIEQNGLYYDLLTHGLLGLSKDDAYKIRDGLLSSYAKLVDTDVMLITLGFIESWMYSPEKAWVNQSAAEPKLRRRAEDFEFFLLDEEVTYNLLFEAIENFKKFNPNMKFVFTVSPVPLTSTLTAEHILIANQRSKAVLHCVAQRLFRELDCVDYFPSYEMITLSERNFAYKDDCVHVQHEAVSRVMERFFKSYFTA